MRHIYEAGVKEELVRVVADLLWNRTTLIYGETIHIGRGVPQGDPLSPLLFILVLQPLSDALAELPCGGASLPGGLTIKDLLYADDTALLAETPEDLNAMLGVCQEWADAHGMAFSIEKSKVMVLAGSNPEDLPLITLYGETLDWVKVFKYLGFPIYANNKTPKYLPLDLTSVFQVIGPMTSVLRPESPPDLPVIQRAQAFYAMVEGKALHNAQVADMDVKNVDSYVNKGLRLVTGLIDSTLLRCDLGILPSELVVHRNAMYYLWHLRRRAWFRHYLPSLAHLQPINRLTSIVLCYTELSLRDIDSMEYEQWRGIVKKAILKRSASYYDTSDLSDYCLSPQSSYSFQYLGQAYLKNAHITHLGQTAIELRHNRLCGVPRPWEHQPCMYCNLPRSLNGRHLLQCPCLPANLIEDRQQLITQFQPGLSLSAFAQTTIACAGAERDDASCPRLVFLCRSLALGRKIMGHARRTARLMAEAEQAAEEDLPLAELFEGDEPAKEDIIGSFPVTCSLQSLEA